MYPHMSAILISNAARAVVKCTDVSIDSSVQSIVIQCRLHAARCVLSYPKLRSPLTDCNCDESSDDKSSHFSDWSRRTRRALSSAHVMLVFINWLYADPLQSEIRSSWEYLHVYRTCGFLPADSSKIKYSLLALRSEFT